METVRPATELSVRVYALFGLTADRIAMMEDCTPSEYGEVQVVGDRRHWWRKCCSLEPEAMRHASSRTSKLIRKEQTTTDSHALSISHRGRRSIRSVARWNTSDSFRGAEIRASARLSIR